MIGQIKLKLGYTGVHDDAFRLIASKLARLRIEHESRMLFLSREQLECFNPMRRITFDESLKAYVVAAGAELHRFIAQLRAEILSLAEQFLLPLSSERVDELVAVAERQVDPALYPRRHELYIEAMIRKGQRYGEHVEQWGMRTDISASLHHVGTANNIRQSIAALRDDLELLRLRSIGKISQAGSGESKLEQVNRLVKLEPNLFGVGINLNYLIRRLFGRKE